MVLEGCLDGFLVSYFEGYVKFVELFGDIVYDGIGEVGGVGDGEYF